MASFFSSMVSDFKSGFTGPEARNYGDGYDYKTPREKRYDAARKVEADQLRNKEDDKPHSQMAKPIYAPPPLKPLNSSTQSYLTKLTGVHCLAWACLLLAIEINLPIKMWN